MLNVTWLRNDAAIMAGSDGYTLSTTTHNISFNETVQSANFTSTLSVDGAINTTHAGQYVCKADLTDKSMNSMKRTLTVQSEWPNQPMLWVYGQNVSGCTEYVYKRKTAYYLLLLFNPLVPPPSVNLTSNVVLIGSPATLQCTVMLHSSLTCSGQVTATVELVSTSPSNSAIDTQTATGSGSTCDAVPLSVSSMVGTSGGRYNCRVQLNYTADNSGFVMLPGHINSNTATLYVVGEWLTIHINHVLKRFLAEIKNMYTCRDAWGWSYWLKKFTYKEWKYYWLTKFINKNHNVNGYTFHTTIPT